MDNKKSGQQQQPISLKKKKTEGAEETVSFSPSWKMPFLNTIITVVILFMIYVVALLVKSDDLTNSIRKTGVLPIAKTMFILTPYLLLLTGICCSLYWFRWLITRRYTITPESVTIQYLLRKNKKTIIIPINKIATADKKIQNVFQKKLNTGDALIFTYGSSHKRRYRLVNIPESHEKVSLINEYSKKNKEERLQKKIELLTGAPKKTHGDETEKKDEEEKNGNSNGKQPENNVL